MKKLLKNKTFIATVISLATINVNLGSTQAQIINRTKPRQQNHQYYLGQKIEPELEKQVLEIIRQNPEIIIESIQIYQEKQRKQQQETRDEFLQTLKTNPDEIIGDSPVFGNPKAKIVLIEFSDFQCPFCAQAQTPLKEFMAKYKEEVKLVYKHLPIPNIHPQAIPASKSAIAAGKQGKFWEYHDALFAQQEQLSEELYLKIAQDLDLDIEKFKRDRAIALTTIQRDLTLAQQLGINGTPFFIMNGEVFAGAVNLADLEATLAKIKAEQN